jgi:hypothetical protein
MRISSSLLARQPTELLPFRNAESRPKTQSWAEDGLAGSYSGSEVRICEVADFRYAGEPSTYHCAQEFLRSPCLIISV